MSEKLTRQQLRHDWLIDHSLTAWLWIRDHLAIAGGAVAVIALGFALWLGVSHRSAAQGHDMDEAFARASQEFEMGSYQTAAVAYDNFVSRFGSSKLAGEAMLRGAASHLFTGDIDGAQAMYQKYLDTHQGQDPFLDRAAKHGLAACHESKGDYAGAATLYREIGDAAGNKVERAYHLRAAARALEMQGQLDEAAKIYVELSTPSTEDLAQGMSPDPRATDLLLELQAKQYLAGDRSRPFAASGS